MPGWQRDGVRLVKQLGCYGLAVVLGTFSIELRRKDFRVKLFVVVFQLVSMDEHLEQEQEAFETVGILSPSECHIFNSLSITCCRIS